MGERISNEGNHSVQTYGWEADYLQTSAGRLRTDPHNLGAFEAAGALLLARGKLEESLECFHRITWENPAYPRVWRLNAKVFEALGATQNAAVCRDGGACVHS